MFLVAARVAEIHLAVLDDRIRPVGDVKPAVGAELNVDGPEGDVGRAQQVGHFLGLKTGVRLAVFEAHDAMGAEIAGNEIALPIVGELGRTDHFQAGELRIVARTDALQFAPRAGVGEIHGAGHAIGDALEARSIGEKRVAVIVPVMAPGIAAAAREDLELIGVGIEPPDAGAVQARDAVRRLDVCVGVNRLVHVDASVVTPAQGVQIVMRVLGAETGQNDASLVRLAVPVSVLEIKQLMAGSDVTTPLAIGQHAGGNQKTVGEHRRFVRLAVPVGVFENDNGIGGGLAGFDLGIDLGTGHPQSALGVPVDFDRLVQLGVFRPQTHLEAIGDFEAGDRLAVEMRGWRRACLWLFRAGRRDACPALGEQSRHFHYGRGILMFEVAKFCDSLFPLLNQRIKPGNFDSVLALLLFAEAEKVSPVFRTPAVKEKFVLFADGGAKQLELRRCLFGERRRSQRPGEHRHDSFCCWLIAGFAEMDPVRLQKHAMPRSQIKEIHELPAALPGQGPQRIANGHQSGIVLADFAFRARAPLAVNRSQQNKPHFIGPVGRGPADLFDGVHEPAYVRLELGDAGFTRERRGHAVTEERHGRLDERDLFFDALEPFVLGFVPVEAGARPAQRRVGRPAEIAKGDIAVGKRRREAHLYVAIVHFALKKRVADEEDAVAVLEFQGVVGSCERARTERGDERQTGERMRQWAGELEYGFHRPLSAVKMVIAIMPAPAALGWILSGKYSGRSPRARCTSMVGIFFSCATCLIAGMISRLTVSSLMPHRVSYTGGGRQTQTFGRDGKAVKWSSMSRKSPANSPPYFQFCGLESLVPRARTMTCGAKSFSCSNCWRFQ